jgi:hypothetical protein
LDRNRGFSAFLPLLTVWMLGLMPYQALQTLQMSQNFLAADIFTIAPLRTAAPVFHGVRKATIFYLFLPALAVAGVLIGYLAPGGLQGLQLSLPGLIVIPLITLFPALTEDYLPLSRPAVRGDQSTRNVGLILISMFGMAIVLGIAYIAWMFEVLWYLIGIELIVVTFLFWLLNRIIKNRPLARSLI